MKKIEVIKSGITTFISRSGLQIKKYSPEILMVAGVAGIIGTMVLVHKSAKRVEDVVEHAEKRMSDIEHRKIRFCDYTEKEYKKDKTFAMMDTVYDFAKLYGPAVVLGTSSICCIAGSHYILRKRNIALMAAYEILNKGFLNYRNNVINELGKDTDRRFKNNIITKETCHKNDDGEISVEFTNSINPNLISPYAKFFDESCKEYSKNPEYNLSFLLLQQKNATDMLHARGHLFLNEVYDMLGIPRTQAGSVVGWVIGAGDDYVDFGIYDDNLYRRTTDFVNGYERTILLDFNVDGVIYDKIGGIY